MRMSQKSTRGNGRLENNLKGLQNIYLKQSIKPNNFGKIKNISLHSSRKTSETVNGQGS